MTMHMSEILNGELDRFRKVLGSTGMPGAGGFQILETGTIRSDAEAYRQGDGWSTLTLAQDCEGQHEQGHLTSIDLHTGTARKVIEAHGLSDYVTFRQGYSIEWMASMLAAGERFDVILLDSENDPQLILHEYMLAEKLLRRPGLIMVDDVVPGSATVRKGEQLLPWLEGRGTPYHLMPRSGGGVHSGVLSVIK